MNIENKAADIKGLKKLVIFCTILYGFFLILCLWNIVSKIIRIILWYSLYPMLGFLWVSIAVAIPLLMIIFIAKLWSHYIKRNVNKVYLYSILPLLVLVISFLI
jgi:hypothetical protein